MVLPRRTSSPAAVAALLAANLVPLAGVVWWGWSVFEVLVLYWLESGVVGLLNVPKILLAKGERSGDSRTRIYVQGVPAERFADSSGGNLALALFFVVHYGVFWVVHGVFVFALPLFALGSGTGGAFGGGPISGGPLGGATFGRGFGTAPSVFALAVASMALSHGLSFAANYVARGEYRAVSPDEQMMRPYGRVTVLHLTVLVGAWLVASLGSPLAVLALLVVLKTALDLRAHRRDHRRPTPDAGTGGPKRQG